MPLKSKTQSRHALENAVSTMEATLQPRGSKKQRSKSRESQERLRRQASQAGSDIDVVELGGRGSEAAALSAELNKIKKELEAVKKVCLTLLTLHALVFKIL